MTLRIIVRTDDASDYPHTGAPAIATFKTFDIEAPEIEEYLNAGGRNEDGAFLVRSIIGVEELR